MLSSRERVNLILNHQAPDRVPLDLGAAPVTGMHASSVYKLRQALKLDPPGTPVKVICSYQILGEIKPDLIEALGVDTVGIQPLKGHFGFKNEGWKPWELPDGTPVLVPEMFNTKAEPDGTLFQYPEGDRSVPPSGRMPKGGFYFDAIRRQPPLDEDNLNPEDNMEEFKSITDEELAYFEQEVRCLYEETDKAIVANFGGTAFGDISMVPAPWLKHPKGIRDEEEWYISTITRPEYIHQVFELQCEVALANLEKIYEVVGDRVAVMYHTGNDFGTQNAPFLSVETYRELYYPFHKRINDWVHENTSWKTFMHSDGSIMPLLPSISEAGIDILNPIQWTAKNMDPQTLKERFGNKFVFWGGGVDTQKTLPFGKPEEVRAEVKKHLRIFGQGGG